MNYAYVNPAAFKVPAGTSCFPYGSKVYGTDVPGSDVDIIAVYPAQSSKKDAEIIYGIKQAFHGGLYDVHIVPQQSFQDRLDRHEMSALECFFLPDDDRYSNDLTFKFKLNREQLINETIYNSDKSWEKAEKYLGSYADQIGAKQGSIGRKAAFHSMRVISFAEQILDHGSIEHYQWGNQWLEHANRLNHWNEFENSMNNNRKNFILSLKNSIKK